MTDRRSFFSRLTANRGARVSARLVTGLIGVGVAGTVVIAAGALPLPTLGEAPEFQVVTPVSAAQQRVCPGPVLRLGDTSGAGADVANTVGSAALTQASTSGTPQRDALATADNPDNTPPQRLTLDAAPPSDAPAGEPELLAGAQSQSVNDGDLRGFAASACAPAAAESWLVGGSTLTGRTTLVLLSNPSTVSATVDLQIYTEQGLLSSAGSDGIVIPPGTQRVLSLAGFAPDAARPVVRVVSSGGEVVANLEQSIVRTLDPGGVDLIGGSGPASTLNVIPGLVLSGHEAIEAMLSGGGYDDAFPVVRILVPGAAAAAATITIATIGETTPPVTVPITVEPGVVTDFPLTDFADGSYTVTVATDVPAVVSARSTVLEINGALPTDPSVVPTLAGTDFAWFTTAPELRTRALVAVAAGSTPVLHIANQGLAVSEVTVDGPGVDAALITVPAGGSVSVPVQANSSYTLTGFDTVYASVSYRDRGALAGYVVYPPQQASLPIAVYRGSDAAVAPSPVQP